MIIWLSANYSELYALTLQKALSKMSMGGENLCLTLRFCKQWDQILLSGNCEGEQVKLKWTTSNVIEYMNTGACISTDILTATHTAHIFLIGNITKSEITLQVASICRLFCMGNYALMEEPSTEQSWESHDGMVQLQLVDGVIGWSDQIGPLRHSGCTSVGGVDSLTLLCQTRRPNRCMSSLLFLT